MNSHVKRTAALVVPQYCAEPPKVERELLQYFLRYWAKKKNDRRYLKINWFLISLRIGSSKRLEKKSSHAQNRVSDEHPRPFDMRVPREISPSAFSISKTSWFPKVDEIHGIVRRFTGAGCFFQAYSLYLVADYTRGCFLPRILCQSPFCLSVCRSIDGRRDWQTMISFDNGHRLSESRLK